MNKNILFVLHGVIQNFFTKKILLVQRSKNDKWNPGKWEFPGGKADDWIILKDIGREIKEEVGFRWLRFGKMKVLDIKTKNCELEKYKGKKVVTIFLFARTFFWKVKLSHEHDDYLWIKTVDDLKGLDLKEGIRETLEGIL